MMIFSTQALMDEQRCYEFLVNILHPQGLHCPHCQCPVEQAKVHRRDRAPLLYFRCPCGRIYNALTRTCWQGTHHRCSVIVRLLQGFAQGIPTRHLAQELGIDRKHLLERRHLHQAFVAQASEQQDPLPDAVTEVDEMYQNSGEKGVLHDDPEDPPRCRANKVRGHGTWDKDRPPIAGLVGRESGQVRLEVKKNSTQAELEPFVLEGTQPNATVNTDEWSGYHRLSKKQRTHSTVCHAQRVWARDDDGDGIREVHNNTIEGLWTGLRNFLRPFRGVNKAYLQQYIAMHEWAYNLKEVTVSFLRLLCGVTQFAP